MKKQDYQIVLYFKYD